MCAIVRRLRPLCTISADTAATAANRWRAQAGSAAGSAVIAKPAAAAPASGSRPRCGRSAGNPAPRRALSTGRRGAPARAFSPPAAKSDWIASTETAGSGAERRNETCGRSRRIESRFRTQAAPAGGRPAARARAARRRRATPRSASRRSRLYSARCLSPFISSSGAQGTRVSLIRSRSTTRLPSADHRSAPRKNRPSAPRHTLTAARRSRRASPNAPSRKALIG